MPAPIIALLTDFGLQDAYVGIMKGVILSHCPEAKCIDLTHHIPPHDILAGAVQLQAAVPYCPEHTIFLAVVDPGVGSARRPICLRSGGRFFVGPDNGLLWPAAADLGQPEAFHLDQPQFWLPHPGSTFHGRDIFSPVAAWLALGHEPEVLGSSVPDPIHLKIPQPSTSPEGVWGEVIYVDHFGNAVTNLRPDDLQNPVPETWSFWCGSHRVLGPATHYGSVTPGTPLVVASSFGWYEIAINGGNAAAALDLGRGSRIFATPA
jgi:S-adenosylmethionine hydrolase